MLDFVKRHLKLAMISYDLLAIPCAWSLAYWLRENMYFLNNSLNTENFLLSISLISILQISFYSYFKVYRGVWRYVSVADIRRIVSATFSALLGYILLAHVAQTVIPRTILPLYAVFIMGIWLGARMTVRALLDKGNIFIKTSSDAPRVLIVGAGHAAEGLIRELRRTQQYQIIGLVDDDKQKHGMDIHGLRVMGEISCIENICQSLQVDLILIAIASADSKTMRTIVRHCEQSDVPFKSLPKLTDFSVCNVSADSLRKVSIEDLLGREQISIEVAKINSDIADKVVLVTGGGGSIGSELCRQIARFKPRLLIILDNNEYNLYSIDNEFAQEYADIERVLALLSVTDNVGINKIFAKYQPEMVFHAAAYKHVPMLEDKVRIAVRNNLIGTKLIAEASIKYKAAKFVLISTDKAVNPTNVMGATKRAAEIYCQNLNLIADTKFITVRFGNVLGSTGSVVPIFKAQLAAGGPLTVTHPDMQRYFMTIPEATQLILQAMVNGLGGEIFVLDMGEPVKITYLAEQMIRLSGLEPGKDIKIQYSGLRPGEKLFEELFHSSELLLPTKHNKLLQARFREIDWQQLNELIDQLDENCHLANDKRVLELLHLLVPEYKSDKFVADSEVAAIC